jgi:hypothetical protein
VFTTAAFRPTEGGGARPELRLPNVVKILIGIGLLIAVNELVPEVVPAMLILVAMYLVLNRSDVVAMLLGSTSSDLDDLYRR